jgi:glycosyltransferase involved in cell wall biosynthesis
LVEKSLLVPGWTRFPGLSAAMLRRAVSRAIRRFGPPDALLYTLPQYAPVAQAFAGKFRQIYYAHDPFRFYDWDAARTIDLERQMLAACDGTFAISWQLTEDLQAQSSRPVIYSPNAASRVFMDALSAASDVPEDLRSLPRPIIGCIGQINRSYDWTLIGALADGLPEATFAFVGPIFPEPVEVRRPMEAVLARGNVKWLGPRPHGQLPGYLLGFNVCLNPLAMSEHNHRRSPLRLYDYLATDKPVLSTAVREALGHGDLVATFKTPREGIELLNRMVAGDYRVDLAARRAYLRNNTWEARAAQFLRHVEALPQGPTAP